MSSMGQGDCGAQVCADGSTALPAQPARLNASSHTRKDASLEPIPLQTVYLMFMFRIVSCFRIG